MWPIIVSIIGLVAVGAGVFLVTHNRARPPAKDVDTNEGTALFVLGMAFIALNTVFALTLDWGWYGLPIGIVFVALGARRMKAAGK